jgi:hypothetical protein
MDVRWVVQEHHRHGGVVFKVYVIGDEAFVDLRPSTPEYAAARKSQC